MTKRIEISNETMKSIKQFLLQTTIPRLKREGRLHEIKK